MGKRVQITDEVRARLARTVGADANADDYVIYECVALNTLPLRQKGSLFDSARVSEATLSEMAAVLQRGEGIPIQLMHDTRPLPVGKAFYGEIHRDGMGRPELRAQFYVSKQHMDIIAKLDDATVDEVSVGFQAQKITCSKCGFDYLGPDADLLNVFSLTCNKNHTVGQDGVFVNVDGLSVWHELSLVGKGAAQGAKILPQFADQETALAASGVSGKALILQLTASQEQTMPDPVTVNLSELTGFATQLATAQAELATAKQALEGKAGEVTELTAKIENLNTQIAELSAKLTEAEAKPSEQVDTEATLSFLKEQHQKLNVALGQKDAAVPETAAELIAGITAAQAKLSSLIPVGGVSNPAIGDAARASGPVNAAFKSRK